MAKARLQAPGPGSRLQVQDPGSRLQACCCSAPPSMEQMPDLLQGQRGRWGRGERAGSSDQSRYVERGPGEPCIQPSHSDGSGGVSGTADTQLPCVTGLCAMAGLISLPGPPGLGPRGSPAAIGVVQLCSLRYPSPMGSGLILPPAAQVPLQTGPNQSHDIGWAHKVGNSEKPAAVVLPTRQSAILGRRREGRCRKGSGKESRAGGWQGGQESPCQELTQATRGQDSLS